MPPDRSCDYYERKPERTEKTVQRTTIERIRFEIATIVQNDFSPR